MSELVLLRDEELKMQLRPHIFSFFYLYIVFFLLLVWAYIIYDFFAQDKFTTFPLYEVIIRAYTTLKCHHKIDLNKNIRYQDTSISSGMWRYTGKESGGKGVYRNLNNDQFLSFDRNDFDIFRNNLGSHFDFSESINEDIYYYESDWLEKMSDAMTDGLTIYFQELEDENYNFEEVVQGVYEEYYNDKKQELIEKLIDEYFQNNILENKNDVRTKAYGN